MKLLRTRFIATAVLLGAAPFATAAPSLINIDTGPGYGTFTGAGILGGGAWTQVYQNTTNVALNYSDGTASGVLFTISSKTADYYTRTNIDPAWYSLMDAYQYLYNGSTTTAYDSTITLSGFQANTLMSVVLYGADAAGQGSTFTYAGTTKVTSDTGGIGATLVEGDEYVRFDNVQADASGNVSFTWSKTAGNLYSALNGMQVQITAVPEPATYGLLGAGALAGVAFVRRRRRFVRNAA